MAQKEPGIGQKLKNIFIYSKFSRLRHESARPKDGNMEPELRFEASLWREGSRRSILQKF